VKKLSILLVLALVALSVAGCETAQRTSDRNLQYLGDDAARATGFAEPSTLHARDNVPGTLYEPYRPIE